MKVCAYAVTEGPGEVYLYYMCYEGMYVHSDIVTNWIRMMLSSVHAIVMKHVHSDGEEGVGMPCLCYSHMKVWGEKSFFV